MRVRIRMVACLAMMFAVLQSAAAAGDAGHALRFDGVDDFVAFGPGDTTADLSQRNFTLEAWVKPDGSTATSPYRVVVGTAYQPCCSDFGYGLGIQVSAGPGPSTTLEPLAHIAQVCCQNDSVVVGMPAASGTWIHLATTFEYQGTTTASGCGNDFGCQGYAPFQQAHGTFKFYVDGILFGAITAPYDAELRPQLMMGSYMTVDHAPYNAGSGYFKGDLDEVRIWSHARTQVEILSTMHTTLSGSEEGLVGYWNFDEGAGQVVENRGNPDAWLVDEFGWHGLLGGSSAVQTSDPIWVVSDAPVGRPLPVTSYCAGDGSVAPCPCGNESSSSAEGCRNSTQVGGILAVASGSVSAEDDDLQLVLSQLRPNQSAILFHGNAETVVPFGDGLRCVTQGVLRFPIRNTGPQGSFTEPGAGVIGIASFTSASAGSVGLLQGWYRDPSGPCLNSSNLTNALRIPWER